MAEMSAYPSLGDLTTESDVEQKLLWPILTNAFPLGLGFSPSDVFTKLCIRRLEIGKDKTKKVYYPDYLIVMAGLPVIVVEAKAVGEDLSIALHEARLYGNEINALFPHGTNPCVRVVACNGNGLCTALIDSSIPDIELSHSDLSPASVDFAKFTDNCCRKTMQVHVNKLRQALRKTDYKRPVTIVGGSAFQGEELAQNTFGATITGDYGHFFNPKTRDDRSLIVRKAYIGSLRHQRYIEPIDRLIRNAVAPTAARIRPIENSANPREITAALREHRKLENQVMLLIGSVGAGKSTFADYLSLVALPEEIRSKTAWLRLNLNEAPLKLDLAYEWTSKAIVQEFRTCYPEVDFDELSILKKIFRHELSALKRGPLAMLEPTSTEYKVRVADRLSKLQTDDLALAKGITKYICSGPELLLVLVLDNCDKRDRDDQLKMFQIAQWIQSEFNCLVILPLRDVTFDLYRHEPPLDTALKQFIFRIEPPQFSDVLQARVRLVLEEIAQYASSGSTLSYHLPNGIKVTYPTEDQAVYLASILRSLYAHDRFVRQVMTGIAGRDVRRALEIFLDFCMSGHIGEDEIYKIRFFEGQHVLSLSVVARVLLRMHRRFYDGTRSYLKNIVQCDPKDPLPDNFVRLTLLHWFHQKLSIKGPAGVEGFHRVADMVSDLSALGHDSERVREELSYLAREGCLVPEHLRVNEISDDDLVKVTASGAVHLQLMANPEYLAACSEDTWIADENLCKRIAERISRGPHIQYSPVTTARNAKEFVEYLMACSSELLRAPNVFLEKGAAAVLNILHEAEAGVAAAEVTLPERLYVGNVPFDATAIELKGAFEEKNVQIKSMTFPTNNDSGGSRGFAFIEPATKEAVLLALDLDGALTLRGRRLRVNEAHPLVEENIKSGGRERPSPPLSKRVYVANLPYAASEADIRELLSTHDVTAVEIFLMMDKKTGKSKGAGFVELRSKDEAVKVIGALDGIEFMEKKLTVRPADLKEGK